jgi:DNA-directed RNA polymerase specialized sigma24 family protein
MIDSTARESGDARLVARLHAGDRRAWRTLYHRYFDRVFRYARATLMTQADAERATEAAFAAAARALPVYRQTPDRTVTVWLFKHAATAVAEAQQSADGENAAEPASSDEELAWALEQLPTLHRQVLALRHMARLSTPEAAAVLETTPIGARILHDHAMRTLSEALTGAGLEAGLVPC